MNNLVVNCGSSSVKLACINSESEQEVFSILAECLGQEESRIKWNYNGEKSSASLNGGKHTTALHFVLELLEKWGLSDTISAIGHRVVHGGPEITSAVKVSAEVEAQIEESIPLAPLHNPANLKGIRLMKQAFPELGQVIVPDTAFAASIPKAAQVYALPYELCEKYKIRRYGFHGTSHDYLNQQADVILTGKGISGRRIITAHLGNGCSVAAANDGNCLDTSMGLTPLEGLIMGTRSGTIDPGLFTYLQKCTDMTIDEINQLLNKESGLLGISGVTNDMRLLQQSAEEGNKRSQLALDVFVYCLAKQIAAFSVATNGIDALVFSGGIGENSNYVREKTVSLLSFFGFDLDKERNDKNGAETDGFISTDTSLAVIVIPTEEEVMISRLTNKALGL